MLYALLSILSLGFLIVVHEGGHYFVARWCGMRIERFSIGFGKGLLKHTSKKTGTVFQIAPIPFGGFVEIRGMNIAEDVDPDDKYAYPNRPTWQRLATIFAGPATNYLSAIVLAFALFAIHGMDSEWRWYGIAAVNADSPAAGKLEPDDRIVAVDHVPLLLHGTYADPDGSLLRASDTDTLSSRIIAKQGEPVTLTVVRGSERKDITITPKLGTDPKGPKYQLGIHYQEQADTVDVSLFTAARGALEFPVIQTRNIGYGLYRIITNKDKADPGGPVRIVEEFSHAWRIGVVAGIQLLLMLSVYLGMFNLLPLPALDGGRLVFLLYELVTRRRANPKVEAVVHMAGIMVLAVVMVLVTIHDIGRRF